MRIATALVLATLLPAVLVAQDRDVVRPNGVTMPGPFTPAIRSGNLVFASGQLGIPLGGTALVPGGVRSETRQALENLDRIFQGAGTSLARAVKCTVFMADIAEWDAMNEVYQTFFTADPPARSTIAAAGLVRNGRVEIECIAVVAP
jgi:2-iminobutanoate/2-iminopropanoate deaminase